MSADTIASLAATSVADTSRALSMDVGALMSHTDVTAIRNEHTEKCIVYADMFWKTYDEMRTAQRDYFDRLAEGIDSLINVAMVTRNAAEIAHHDARETELKMLSSFAEIEDATIALSHTKHAAASNAYHVACKSYSVLEAALKSSDHVDHAKLSLEASTLMQRLLKARSPLVTKDV